MKEFFSSTKFKVLIAVCVVLVGLLLYALTAGRGNLLEQGLDFILKPLQSLTSSFSNGVGSFFERHLHVDDVYNENEALKDEIAALKEQLIQFDGYKLENEELKRFLEIKELNPEFELETATVIGSDPLDSFGSFTIDKGSLHGIEQNDVVICREGLVGIAYEVNPISTRVITLLDPSLRVSSKISATGDTGMIKNTTTLALEDRTRITMLSRDTKAIPGNLVVTAGTGGAFPKDILIGVVASVEPDANGLSQNAVIVPAADIRNVRHVAVIKSFAGQGVPILEPQVGGESDSE